MELVTFKALIDIALALFDLSKIFKGDEERRRSGTWMVGFGDLVQEVSNSLELGEFPHASCAKMGYLADHFREMMQGMIDDVELDRLESMVTEARNLERLYGELGSVPESERWDHLFRLEEIAGTLQGAGEMMATR